MPLRPRVATLLSPALRNAAGRERPSHTGDERAESGITGLDTLFRSAIRSNTRRGADPRARLRGATGQLPDPGPVRCLARGAGGPAAPRDGRRPVPGALHRRLGAGSRAARARGRKPRAHSSRLDAANQVLAQGGGRSNRGADHRGQRGHDLPRAVPESQSEPAPSRAIPRAPLGERRRAGRRIEQGGPMRGSRPERRGREDSGARRNRSRDERARAGRAGCIGALSRRGPHGRARRIFGRRQIDHRESPARERPDARPGNPRGRSRPPHDHVASAHPPPRRRNAPRHARDANGSHVGRRRGTQDRLPGHRGAGRPLPFPRLRPRDGARLRRSVGARDRYA